MQTIEERALKYGKSFEFQKGTRYVSVASKEYIKIATEQRDIDIEIAEDWLKKACSKYPIQENELPILLQSFEHAVRGLDYD